MKQLFWLLLALSFTNLSMAQITTASGIPLDKVWKVKLYEFATKYVVHQSWGLPHAERNYHNTLRLAKLEGIRVDEDVILAAALLHDVGGLPPHEEDGVDHGVRSAEVGIPLLTSIGFPKRKLEMVKEIIIGHVYYGPMPDSIVARIFRDADILDFLGVMGIARIFGANQELGKESSLKNSTDTLESLMKALPKQLATPSAKEEAANKIKKMESFLFELKNDSYDGKIL